MLVYCFGCPGPSSSDPLCSTLLFVLCRHLPCHGMSCHVMWEVSVFMPRLQIHPVRPHHAASDKKDMYLVLRRTVGACDIDDALSQERQVRHAHVTSAWQLADV